jgi:predicted  nucleic acid-binding Zn-ribbon protein
MTEAKPIPERWRASYSTAGGSHWHDFDWSAKLLEAIEELGAAEAKVEQLVGDLHAVSADYAEVRAQVETLVAALREIRDKEDAYAYKYMAREALREVGRE